MAQEKLLGIYLDAVAGAGIKHGSFSPGWLKEYDPDAHEGEGRVVATNDPAAAMRFAKFDEILTLWNTVPSTKPIRGDGVPNRPLRAFTITVKLIP